MENQNQFDGLGTFEHIVVLMLENRSFDNLLGYLYENDEVPANKSFDGLYNPEIDYANPIPPRVTNTLGNKSISPSRAANYQTPYPDPGEEYPHVNTQLFNNIEPSSNVGLSDYLMTKPYNLPNPVPPKAGMNGFVNDYESNLRATYRIDSPTYEQYEVIMQCFQPDQIPAMATLAKEFAVFDHWYCSVPSQTYCNRAFWHAASSGGKVINPLGEDGSGLPGIDADLHDMDSWIKEVWSLPTIFERMNEKDVSWKVYSPIAPLSLTNIVNGFGEGKYNTHGHLDFFVDLEFGTLPQYSFVEPQFLHKHNDQHPSAVNHALTVGTVKLGDELIREVYTAIKNSPKRDKILFIITHDEHGGCYDHVSPPETVPPVAGMKGECDFTFDRLGVRVPMIMVSSYIQPNTIINEQFEHTSFIKTVCQKWGLDPLTDRDKDAKIRPFTEVFSSQKRTEWPDIPWEMKLEDLLPEPDTSSDPLNGLQKAMLISLLHIEKERGLGNTQKEDIKTIGDMMEFIKRF
ncbi:alkaline phosphatase family protein [Flavobacterium tructae]|uniref:alkaline phosphatase family protein n=1 Tax=Flavobacterium tructae TaxID=1114873 RepID=UPI002551D229|nr:alkaline phosphatase family protein [Flavobacterium tructae]MDL2144749.1 alkaline phosphatase family protein [Flavobacterium tructae]